MNLTDTSDSAVRQRPREPTREREENEAAPPPEVLL